MTKYHMGDSVRVTGDKGFTDHDLADGTIGRVVHLGTTDGTAYATTDQVYVVQVDKGVHDVAERDLMPAVILSQPELPMEEFRRRLDQQDQLISDLAHDGSLLGAELEELHSELHRMATMLINLIKPLATMVRDLFRAQGGQTPPRPESTLPSVEDMEKWLSEMPDAEDPHA